ncbi:hypothetical protein, partial [Escherichia coli]
MLYRYALAIARAAEGDKMPIKKPEFDEGRTQASVKEGANKQVISSQVDSLIKISRIWADFFPANTS